MVFRDVWICALLPRNIQNRIWKCNLTAGQKFRLFWSLGSISFFQTSHRRRGACTLWWGFFAPRLSDFSVSEHLFEYRHLSETCPMFWHGHPYWMLHWFGNWTVQIAPQGAAKTVSEFFRTGIIAMLSEIGAATSNLSRPSQGQGGQYHSGRWTKALGPNNSDNSGYSIWRWSHRRRPFWYRGLAWWQRIFSSSVWMTVRPIGTIDPYSRKNSKRRILIASANAQVYFEPPIVLPHCAAHHEPVLCLA